MVGAEARRPTPMAKSRGAAAGRSSRRRGRTASTWCTEVRPVSKLIAQAACRAARPEPADADGLDRAIPVGLQVGDPRPEGEGVVLPQALDVTHLEAGACMAEITEPTSCSSPSGNT